MKELVYHRFLLPAVERQPDRTAVLDGELRHTFSEHLERVLKLVHALRSVGVGPGDRISVMALNGHRFLELYHASLLGGAVINPLNLRLAPHELQVILSDSASKVCFADGFFAPTVEQVLTEAGVAKLVVMGAGAGSDGIGYEDLLASGRSEVPAEPDECSPAILMYTGGTTGVPRGALLDQRALMVNLYKVGSQWGTDASAVYLHQTPMFHAASLGGVLSVPAFGAASTFVPLFAPDAVIDLIERHGVTMTVMVPTMIAMMLDHAAFDPDRMRSLSTLIYGASPMPTALIERVMSVLPHLDLYQAYGMTENCGLLTCLGPEEHRLGGALLRSAGRPLQGSVVTIQDEAGRPLPPGEAGEVCARAGNFMREYWRREKETESAFRGGWYHTGDAGYTDDEGYVYLVDRVKDMIVSGGENVYSVEVEDAIASHPAVAQVAVIGVPSDQWGEAVVAIVVPKPGAEVTGEEIQAWARQRIAGYKVPKTVELRHEPLPLSGAMKVLKRELRAPYWAGRDRAVD